MSWQVAAASEIGRHHRLLGKNRQDAVCYAVSEAAVAIAVTDGCGSAPHSEVGAYLGVHAAVAAMLAGEEVAPAVRRCIAPALVEEAFLFTLCGACISDAGVFAFIYGDGTVAVDDEVFRFHVDTPDYLAYHAAPEPLFARRWARASRVLVATDGCDGLDLLALTEQDRHFSHPDALRRTLARAACHDDASIVMARSRP